MKLEKFEQTRQQIFLSTIDLELRFKHYKILKSIGESFVDPIKFYTRIKDLIKQELFYQIVEK